MNIEQIALQLGLAGLIVLVGYKVAVLFIERWSDAESERSKQRAAETIAITGGIGNLASLINQHAVADTASHANISDRVSRLEGKIDAALDWQERTPLPILTDSSGNAIPRPSSPSEAQTTRSGPSRMRTTEYRERPTRLDPSAGSR